MVTSNSTGHLGQLGLGAGPHRVLEHVQRLVRGDGVVRRCDVRREVSPGATSAPVCSSRKVPHRLSDTKAVAGTLGRRDVARAAPISAVLFGDFRFDPADGSLWRGEEWVHLAPTPAKLLALLIARAGRRVERHEILENVWGGVAVTAAVVKVAVAGLRRTLGDDPKSPRFIRTESRRGYRFIAPLQEIEPGSAPNEVRSLTLSSLVGLEPNLEEAPRRLVRLLEEAQERLESGDFATCADLLTSALDAVRFLFPSDELLTYEISFQLGAVASVCGRVLPARSALMLAAQAARALGDWERFCGVAVRLGLLRVGSGEVDREVTALLEEGLAQLPESNAVLRECSLAALTLARLPELQRTAGEIQLPERPQGRLGRGAEGLILIAQLLADWRPQNFEQRGPKSARCLERLTGRPLESTAQLIEINYALEAGDAERFVRALHSYRELLARNVYDARQRWSERKIDVLYASMQGDFETAERKIQECLEVGQDLAFVNVPQAAQYQLLWLRTLQGRFEETSSALERRCKQGRSNSGLRAGLAFLRAEIGDRAGAHELLRELVQDELAALEPRLVWLASGTQLADTCAVLGDRTIARTLYRRLLPFENQCAISFGIAFLGSMHRPLGRLAVLLGKTECARRHFELALLIHRRLGATPLVELTRRQRDQAFSRNRAEGAGHRGDVRSLST